MSKYFVLLSFVFFCVSGCVQTKYGHSVYFRNKCNFDVDIYAFRHSNYFKDEKAVVRPSNLGFVLSYVATGSEMLQVIPDEYYLEVVLTSIFTFERLISFWVFLMAKFAFIFFTILSCS